jgi:hypothetical protein
MIQAYTILANRIRKELTELEQVLYRAERAIEAGRNHPEDQDLYVDSAALSLHDFYSGLERIFQQIASAVDGSLPSSSEWHRELLIQMNLDLPDVRPPVLSNEITKDLDEYLRFRHVVRNVYAFSFDQERIGRLVDRAQPMFESVRKELLAFAEFLDQVGRE